jgi:hypothetical protein
VFRCTLFLGMLLLSPVACGERQLDVLSTLRGRCAGTWEVVPEHVGRVQGFQPPRGRLVLELRELQPLGEAIVPGKTYAQGTLRIGETSCECALEFRLRRDGRSGTYLRYVSTVTSPFGPGGDESGFYLDLVTDGEPAGDWLQVDFERDGEPRKGAAPHLTYVRAP